MAEKLYVIASSKGPVKVGITGNPKQRLKWFQTASPEKLDLVHVFEVGSNARAIERQAHGRLKPYHLTGEWFDTTPDNARQAITASILEFTGPKETALEKGFVMPLLSISKAAKLFNVSRPTLQKAVREGTISGLKVMSGGSESWQIDTAELARLYKLRDDSHGKLASQSDDESQTIGMDKSGDNEDLSGKVVRALEAELKAAKAELDALRTSKADAERELAASQAVAEERRRILDDMTKQLTKPDDQTRRRGLWARLIGKS